MESFRRSGLSDEPVTHLRVAPGGRQAVVVYKDGRMRLWRVGERQQNLSISETDAGLSAAERAPEKTTAIAYSADSALLACGREKGFVDIFL